MSARGPFRLIAELWHAPFLGLAFALALGSAIGCGRAAPPPHVIIVSVDTLSRSALHAFDAGAPVQPNLEAFADESTRFDWAVSTASWTLPAFGSLLTGLYPRDHGATDPRVALPPDVPTLAGQLHARGYETVALHGGGFLHARYGLGRGFDLYENGAGPDGSAGPMLDRAAEWVRSRPAGGPPLFLLVHTYRVHDYYTLHPEALARLAHPPSGDAAHYAGCLEDVGRCDETDWETLRALYSAEVIELDEAFGRLRAALEASGLWRDAIVIVLSDHGEGFEPGLRRIHHAGRLHADLVRIPLLVRVPGGTSGQVEAPVSLIDVMPTVLELTGASAPATIEGRSLVPLLGGRSVAPSRVLFASSFAFSWFEDRVRMRVARVRNRPLSVAIIDDDRWYIRSPHGEELYDMARDPRQERNLADTDPAIGALREQSIPRFLPRRESAPISADARLQHQLRALGYAE
jgi:choline-sulfatase